LSQLPLPVGQRWPERLTAASGAVALAAITVGIGHAGTGTSAIVFAADRVPAVTGEIYRVDLNGRRVDLSNSPFADREPVVSPTGGQVAFMSDRGCASALYVVGGDGQGLRRITAPLDSATAQPMWAPAGREIALVVNASNTSLLYLVRPGQRWQLLIEREEVVLDPAWSPDGRLISVRTGAYPHTYVKAFSVTGKLVFRVPNQNVPAGWSRRGRFATQLLPRTVQVYDERGRLLFSFGGRSAVWSPDGDRLASIVGDRVEVRTSDGQLVFAKAIAGLAANPNEQIGFDGHTIVIQGVPGGDIDLDLTTGKISPTRVPTDAPRSPNGRLVALTARSGAAFAIRVGRSDGSRTRTLAPVPGCFDDGSFLPAIASLQFTADSRSIVYQSSCPEPFANLYTVAADGTGLRRLTRVRAQQGSPQWSPDGTRIAYVQSPYTGLSCKGCPSSLWVADAGGGSPRQLTHPSDCTFDRSPSWSPDGGQILISRSSCATPGELVVVSADGSSIRDLHVQGDSPAWGPSEIAYIDNRDTPPSLWTIDPSGHDRLRIANLDPNRSPSGPAWSRDGRLAYIVSDANGAVVAITSGTMTQRISVPLRQVLGLAWSHDGSHLLLTARPPVGASFDLYSIDVNTRNIQRLTTNLNATSGSWR
jgi:Tol biopolymer transport system component